MLFNLTTNSMVATKEVVRDKMYGNYNRARYGRYRFRRVRRYGFRPRRRW